MAGNNTNTAQNTTTGATDLTVTFIGGTATLLLPILFFMGATVYLFIGAGAFDLTALALVGFGMLIFGSLLAKTPAHYWKAAVGGMASEMAATVTLLLLAAGVFSAMMKAGGLTAAITTLGTSLGLSASAFTLFVLLASALMATATGSSIGTILTAMPVFFPAGVALGADPALVAGAIMSGAIFGDNLAPVSDVTIISALTQHHADGSTAEVADVVRSRLPYALIALLLAAPAYLFLGTTTAPTAAVAATALQGASLKGLLMLVPVAVLIAVALKTRDILRAITAGLIVGVPLGLVAGLFTPEAVFTVKNGQPAGFLYAGLNNMAGIVLLCLTLFAYTGVVGKANVEGLLTRLTTKKGDQTRAPLSPRGFECLQGALTLATTVLFAGVTSASCALVGSLTDRLGTECGVEAARRSHLLSGFANSLPVLFPFSAFILITLAVAKSDALTVALTPFTLLQGAFYPMALFVVFAVSVATGIGRRPMKKTVAVQAAPVVTTVA